MPKILRFQGILCDTEVIVARLFRNNFGKVTEDPSWKYYSLGLSNYMYIVKLFGAVGVDQ